MFYELIDVESGNLIGTYDSEAEALAVVRHAARENGPAYVNSLALGRSGAEGEGELIAEGAELLERSAHVGRVPHSS